MSGETIAAIVGAIVGGLIGGLTSLIPVFITNRIERRQSKVAVAFDFHREINSESMIRHRMNMEAILAKHFPEKLLTLDKTMPSELHSVWVVGTFYQRLLIAMNYNQIEPSLISPLFGKLFCFFNYFLKKQLLATDWDITHVMRKLEVYMKANTDTKDWTDLKRSARKEAEESIQNLKTKS